MAHPGFPDHYFLVQDLVTGDNARVDLQYEDTGPTAVFHRLCASLRGEAKLVKLVFGARVVDSHDCRTERTKFYVHMLASD